MRVAVTGAGGRLGRALVDALADAPFTGPAGPIEWGRDTFDLDAPESIGAILDRERPEVVVHSAAWTDVDGCALDPDLAMRRNGQATGALAAACAQRRIDLLVISTNEVFDGTRTDGQPYHATDPRSPANPYGRSKAEGERQAEDAFASRPGAALGIARTSWLFGRPGSDYPSRILDAALRAREAGAVLRLVDDEWGTPTYVADVAEAIVGLLAEDAVAGIHHLVNGGVATRATWGRDVLARAGLEIETTGVPSTTWERPSRPPRWGVLAPTPAALRGTDATVAGGDGRLCAGLPSRRSESGMSAPRPPSALPGVAYGAIDRHGDERGSFRELWRASDLPDRRFVQANLSTSAAGVLRGLHLHRRQDDLWVVAEGRAFVALVDARPLVAGVGDAVVEVRELVADEWVVIPTGVAHGFLALDPLQLIYFVTNEYDGSDELGFAWDDPAVGVPWPTLSATPDGRPILSPRDAANPPLADLAVRLRDEAL